MRSLAVTYPSGRAMPPVEPGWDQLLYAAAGVMSVETQAGTWVIPPHRALWAPGALPIRITMHGRVARRSLFFRAELRVLAPEIRVVNVPALVRELVLAAVREAPLDLARPEHARLIGVLTDRLAVLPQAALQLPMPTDSRAVALVQRLLAELDAAEPLGTSARGCGASRRTLERLFRAETGMTIGAWRRRARFIGALRRLADGESVTAVAHKVGYSTPSAFTYAFRRELGERPGLYFQGADHERPS